MSQHVDAIYENGVFRPEIPLNLPEGQRVSFDVEPKDESKNDLNGLHELLDNDFMRSCRQRPDAPSLDEARQILSAFQGSLSDRISAERDER